MDIGILDLIGIGIFDQGEAGSKIGKGCGSSK